jgi:isocitrate lyase
MDGELLLAPTQQQVVERDEQIRGLERVEAAPAPQFANEAAGYTATRHQREVGTGYFDQVATVISNGQSSTTALKDSTETAQFVAAE